LPCAVVAKPSSRHHYLEGPNVKKTVLAAAVVAALTLANVDASAATSQSATKSELQAVQAQMEALAARLGKLEAANTALQAENTELKALVDRRDAETDYLKAQTKELREEAAVASNEISKVKGADWATRIKFKGDLRIRNENIEAQRAVGTGDEAVTADAANRNRMRFRARFGAEAKVTDHSKVVFQLASGDGDPRSTNQTFGNIGSGKNAWIDQAYADWTFLPGAHLVLGKQPQPYWRSGRSLFFDADWNPEGVAVTWERGMFYGTAYGWWLQENHSSDPQGNNEDANLLGAQAGLKFALLGGETRLAAHYYDCGACRENNPFAVYAGQTGSSYGNTTIPQVNGTSTTNVLKYDYDVIELLAEMNLTLFDLPFQVWADWAQNTASDVEYADAWNAGVYLGKASDRRTWEAGVMYQSLDKDALFAQHIDSDFGNGNTDTEGWVLRAGYAPAKNVVLNATYFINTLNKDVPVSKTDVRELDYDRLQLDINYKF
jgi:hypothetical protein